MTTSMREALIADLIDLHKQATTERSHYYVASVVKRCIAALSSPPPDRLSEEERDIRWAVNVLLEQIAKKFEAHETLDLWRSDAASIVRSFKHDLAARQPEAEPVACPDCKGAGVKFDSGGDPDACPTCNVEILAGRTLAEWREFARRDDCLERMVPSDLRQLIGAVISPRLDREKVKTAIRHYLQMLMPNKVQQTSDGGVRVCYSVIEVDVLADAIMRETR